MRRYLPAVLHVAAVALAAVALVRWNRALSPATVPAPVRAAAVVAPPRAIDDSLAGVEEETVNEDPFRLANAPASVRYDPATDGAAPAAMAAAPPRLTRPALALKAIVGGPPWQAVVDGMPGQPPGLVVQAGASFGGLVVRAVSRDSVVIAGPDTTWVLTFRGHQ